MSAHLEPLRRGPRPGAAKAICVFVHGRTQSPEDMIEMVVGRLSRADVSFVLPRAAGASWYAARAVDPLSDQTRRELSAALDYLGAIVAGAIADAAPGIPLLIGGFSQGACLTLEYAMKHGPWRGAMAALTGCRVGAEADERPFADLQGMPAYLTGSDADPWVPLASFAQAFGALGAARANLRAESFPGRAHTIAAGEIAMLDKMLAALIEGRAVFG